MTITVHHDVENERFVAPLESGEALLRYDVLADKLDYTYTFVPEPMRGRGIASALATEALEYARTHDKSVRPSCSFVRAFIERHPEYEPLVAD